METTQNIERTLGNQQQTITKEELTKEEKKINNEQALIDAILLHDEESIQTLIDNPKLNFQYVDENGNNLLFYATQEGSFELVKMLLTKKFDINFRNQHGITVLHQAAIIGRMDLVELFLKNYADIEAVCQIPGKEKQRPLECAIENGHIEVIKRLVEANTELPKVVGNLNAFEYANKYAQIEILKYLSTLGLKVRKHNWREEEDCYLIAIWEEFAIRDKRWPEYNQALEFNISGSPKRNMFNAALEHDHTHIANKLFKNKEHRTINTKSPDNTKSLDQQNREYLESLFKTFIVCIKRNHLNSIKWILKRHPEFLNKFSGQNDDRITPITAAGAAGNTEVVKFLLQQGADIAIRNAGNTFFTYLKSFDLLKNRQEILQLILDTNPAAYEFITDLHNSDPKDHAFIKSLLAAKEFLDQDPIIIKFLAAIVELYYFNKTNDLYLEDRKFLKNIIEHVVDHAAEIILKNLDEQCKAKKPEANEPIVNERLRFLNNGPEKYGIMHRMLKNKLDFMLNRAPIHHFLPYLSFALSCKTQDHRTAALPSSRLSCPIFYTINSFLGTEHSNIFGLGCSDGVLEKYKKLCPPSFLKHFGQNYTQGFHRIFKKLYNERVSLVQRKFQEKFKSNVAAPKLLESGESLQNGAGKKANIADNTASTGNNTGTAPTPAAPLALVPRERSAAERFFFAVECDDEVNIAATLEMLTEQYSKDTLQKAVLHLFSKTSSKTVDTTALLRVIMMPEQAKARPSKKASI